MMGKKLYINDRACFFDQGMDRFNNYWSVVFNPVKERYIKINPSGYKILKVIEENPSISFFELLSRLQVEENSLKRFLENMVQEKIVLVS